MKPLLTALALAGLLAASTAAAEPARRQRVAADTAAEFDNVDARTGGLTLSYQAFTGSIAAYNRTYRSAAAQVFPGLYPYGEFGAGWGSVFDTLVVPLPDDTLVVAEVGHGGITVYGRPTQAQALRGATALADAAIAAKDLAAADRAETIAGLMASLPARVKFAARYGVAGTLGLAGALPIDPQSPSPEAACAQAQLDWNGDKTQQTHRYERRRCDGVTERFDDEGRLDVRLDVRIRADLLTSQEMIRDPKAGWLTSFTVRDQSKPYRDPSQRTLTFDNAWSGELRTLVVTSPTGERVTYDFDARGFNIRVSSPTGDTYDFAYDAAGALTDIGFIDTTHRRFAYDAEGRVTAVSGRNGERTTFLYRTRGGRPETEVRRAVPGRPDDVVILEFDA